MNVETNFHTLLEYMYRNVDEDGNDKHQNNERNDFGHEPEELQGKPDREGEYFYNHEHSINTKLLNI